MNDQPLDSVGDAAKAGAKVGTVGNKAVAALGLAQADRGAIALCGGWALFSLLLFVGFSLLPSSIRPEWFPTIVSLLKIGAFLMATALCWRNAQDPSILSGRMVWQAIAAGMAFYALGDITVVLWRSLWGVTSVVALSDVFYGASYIFLAIGLLNAVLPRKMTLSIVQSLSISTAGTVGIVLACWVNFYMPGLNTPLFDSTSAYGSQSQTASETASQTASDLVAKTSLKTSAEAKSAATGAIANSDKAAPAIIQLIDQRLSRVSAIASLLYVAGDCLLVVMAAALLVSFWGGTYSEAWKLVALAGLCLYVADMLVIYQVRQGSYVQGAPWELFWILSALFFGLAAGVERGISATMREKRIKRRWL